MAPGSHPFWARAIALTLALHYGPDPAPNRTERTTMAETPTPDESTARPSWTKAIQEFLGDTVMMDEKYEYPSDGSGDELLDRIESAVNWVLCAEHGHNIVDDHCGMPLHRFCEWCNVRETEIELVTP